MSLLGALCSALAAACAVDGSETDVASSQPARRGDTAKSPPTESARSSDGGPSRVLVQFRVGSEPNLRAGLHHTNGEIVERIIPQLDLHIVAVPPGESAERVAERYRGHPLVESADPEVLLEPALEPNDPLYEGCPDGYAATGSSSPPRAAAPSATDIHSGGPALSPTRKGEEDHEP